MSRWIALAIWTVTSAALADPPKAPATPPAKAAKPAPTASGYSGLGAESITPEVIAKFAAPPLEARVSRRIQAMLDVRGAQGGYVTSRGDRQIYSNRVTGTSQVWRQDGPMGFPIQLTGGEDNTFVAGLAPDDTYAVVARDVGGQENPGLYVLPLEGGPLRLVQHIPKVQSELQFISDDSKSLFLRSNDRDSASYAIYRYDLKDGKRETIFDDKGLWTIADHRDDNTWLLLKELGSTQQEIYEYDVKAKKLTPLLGQGEVEEYSVAYGAKPGQVLVRTNKLGDFQRLYSLEHGTLTPISPDMRHDVEEFRIDRTRTRIYLQVNEDGYLKVMALDARTYKPLVLPQLPGAMRAWLAGVTRNGRFVQLSCDSSTMPPRTVMYDWQTGKLSTWRVPSTPEIDTRRFAKAGLESYPARDGTKIPMFVWRPAACDGPCPVVVEFHGGPEGQYDPGFSPYVQLFVDAGFTYVAPNVRGSSGYGKAWLHADDGPKRLRVITDIEDAATFIRANWGKDGKPPKIGVTGGSYGGYATLMAMTYFAGAYDVAVEEVGISNLVTFLMNTAPYRRILRTSEYGDPDKDREALVQLSPITHVGKLKGPLLLIQGVNDPRVPVNESLQIYRQLEQRKVPSGLILFPDEGHGASKRGNIVLAIGHTIAFFEKYLLAK